MWELLRRNSAFRESYQQLLALSGLPSGRGQKPRARDRDGERKHLQEEFAKSELAGVALGWLVPDPIFRVQRIEKVPEGEAHLERVVEVGEGTTPDTGDKKTWRWAASNRVLNLQPSARRRGPVVQWRTDQAHPLAWETGPFAPWTEVFPAWNLESPWDGLPSGFQWELLGAATGLLRSTSGSQIPSPPIYSDAKPHETEFFTSWDMAEFRRAVRSTDQSLSKRQTTTGGSDNLTLREYGKLRWFRRLGKKFRVFAVPRAPYTSKEAAEIGRWLASALYSKQDPVVAQLALNTLLGNDRDWATFLDHESSGPGGRQLPSAYYQGLNYIRGLITSIYPKLNPAELFAPSPHRQRRSYIKKA